MLLAIVIMFILIAAIIYALISWLKWGADHQQSLLMWQSGLLTDEYYDKYGSLMPANYMIDTYKYLNFWIQYFLVAYS